MFDSNWNNIYCEGHKIQGETWEETAGKLFEEIDSCCSVRQLKDVRCKYESLIKHIEQSELFFACTGNSNETKITVFAADEEVMSAVLNGSFSEVSDDWQTEMSESLKEISEAAIERIDERISVVEERNAQMKKREKVIMIAALSMGFALSLGINFHVLPNIMNILVIILLIIVAVIPLCWLFRD